MYEDERPPAAGDGWQWERREGVDYLVITAFRDLAGVRAVFSSRRGGVSTGDLASLNVGGRVGDEPAHVDENRRQLARAAGMPLPWVGAEQVHGDRIGVLVAGNAAPGSVVPGVDGLCTDLAGVPLSIYTADCVPVYLADRSGRVVAVVHAGWRGTALGIAARAVRALQSVLKVEPGRLVAAVGPSIGPECYEVDEPVRAAMDGAGLRGWERYFRANRPGHFLMDLWGLNRAWLVSAGVNEDAIFTAGLCTHCHPGWFYSHRQSGGHTGRQVALIAAGI